MVQGYQKFWYFLDATYSPRSRLLWCAIRSYCIVLPTWIDRSRITSKYLEISNTEFSTKIWKSRQKVGPGLSQDGATGVRSVERLQSSNYVFCGHLCSRVREKGSSRWLEWPTYSPACASYNAFHWGCVKDSMLRTRQKCHHELMASSTRKIRAIRRVTL